MNTKGEIAATNQMKLTTPRPLLPEEYGRLLDDMNLISYAKTEYEAVKQVVDKLTTE